MLATTSASKCFSCLSPLMDEKLIDSYDAFVLGHALGKNGANKYESIIKTFEKILLLKNVYQAPQNLVNTVHCLILEQNWDYVIILIITNFLQDFLQISSLITNQ